MNSNGLFHGARREVTQQYRRIRTEWVLARQLRGAQPVLIYSLGKVGTTSLATVLDQQFHVPVVHCHEIAQVPSPADWERRHPDSHGVVPPAAWRGDYIARRMRRDPSARWDIICGVRDPVARHVSALFQHRGTFGVREHDDEDQEIAAIEHAIAMQFREGEAGLDWFDAELHEVTGVDVFAEPFPHDAGYQIYENGRFRVLLIRFEDLARVGPSAVAAFLGVQIAEVPHENVGAQKSYQALYRRFLERGVITDESLDLAYGSRLATHFYTAHEIEAFRARWRASAG